MNIPVLDLEDLEPLEEDLVEMEEPPRPFFLLKGVVFDAELDYVLEDSGVPTYHLGDTFNLLGYIKPSVDVIVIIKFLNIEVLLYRKDKTVWDFSAPEHYISLISL